MLRVPPIHRCLVHRGSWVRLGHVSPNTPPFRPPPPLTLGTFLRSQGQRRPLSNAKLLEMNPEPILAEERLLAKSIQVAEAPAASIVAATTRKARTKKVSPDKPVSKKAKGKKRTTLPAEALPVAVEALPVVETVLRPYQQECIDACLTKLKEGVMRQIVSLPVGSGKTVIFSHLMKQVPPPSPGATKTLILAHRQELLNQTRNHVLRSGAGLTVSIDQGKRMADMDADVIVASVPTLGRSNSDRINKYDPKEFKCIIIDEAHHAAADSYLRILHYFGADVPDTKIFVYGCSATVRRHDGIKLGGVFDYISYHKSFITMIDDKWLCGLKVSTIKTESNLEDVKTREGDFAVKDLSLKVNTDARNDIIVRSYMTYCKERKSTVVFAVDIDHLETLAKVFREYGYDARGLSSNTPDEERKAMLQDFRDRKFPVIVNCGILTEGTDIPVIDSIIMARPTKSNVLFQQMLGRGMRLHPGKEDCLVLDFVDVVRGDGLVTVPTLLGLETDAVLRGDKLIHNELDIDAIRQEELAALEKDIEGAEQLYHPLVETEEEQYFDKKKQEMVTRIRVLEYDNPYQLIDDASGVPRRIWNMSSNAWVYVGDNSYVLACKGETFKIEKSAEDGLYFCTKRSNISIEDKEEDAYLNSGKSGGGASIWSRKKGTQFKSKGSELPIRSDTLEDCVHGVDTWISKNMGHQPELLGRFAKWRMKPASEAQLRYLQKLGYLEDPVQVALKQILSDPEPAADSSSDPALTSSSVGNGKRPTLKELLKLSKQQEKEAKEALREQERRISKEKQRGSKLTKGQAANIITRLVNGAGRRWASINSAKIKKAKVLASQLGVDVGPIPKVHNV
ncbi:ATP-dependent helicase IRC3 [Entomortierella parvispora]|uniref:ATP-dependent helicase IRC3 n=1 Tax=Entomortierella parvispora TaxID=205924 RepID=A0A9P3LUY5_9FUNG|nr:ATP-dependent helicase IRC3 [Entomortierella parvispora]